MGSVSLVCPMCCGETFDNSQSLKYHLLSMTDNLYCPNCAERSDSVSALIQHLDCCGDNRELINIYPSKEYKKVLADAQADHGPCGFLATVGEDGGIVMVGDNCNVDESKEQDNTDIHGTIGNHEGVLEFPTEKEEEILGISMKDNWIKVKEENPNGIVEEGVELVTDNSMEVGNSSGIGSFEDGPREDPDENELVQVKEEMPEVESDALYSCSSCDMSFNSVLSHIKEYHDGQEVVLEMAEQQMDDLPGDTEDDKEAIESLGMRSEPFLEENSSADSSRPLGNSSGGLPRQRRTMNTLRTEECVDSEGRLYTRKVVQIERFWDRGTEGSAGSQSHSQQRQSQHSSKSASMIEKFFSNAEGLKIRTKSPKTIKVITTATTTAATPMTVATTTTSTTTSTTNSTATSSWQATAPLTIRMYRCNKCLEQFVKLADFRVHACIHGNNQCDLCEQAFASAKALQLHSRIHEAEAEEGNDSNFICQTCGTEFSSHKSLRLHSRMHAPVRARHVDAPEGTATENFTCVECGKTLSESYRKAHMALHKGDSVTCSVCNRKFDSADSLAMHAAVHIEFAQSQQQQQQQHKQVVAQSLEDQRLEDESNGGKRMKTGKEGDKSGGAGDAPEKPYQCQHCGRRFTRPHEKVKHERIHTGEKPHACEVCGKTFRVSYCLTLHMRTHTGVRPYACQHCGKRFKASSVYNHHLLTHGEERAYTCPYCPKTFKTRVQLAGHKNSHTKPFRCTECSRPFASLYAARAHIQTHKKDNNLKFSCYICGASYGRAFALKDHLKQHTGQDVLAPPPEPAREEEVIDADEFIISAETEEYEEIEEIEEIEEEEHKLVEVAAAAAAAHGGVPRTNFIDCNDRSE